MNVPVFQYDPNKEIGPENWPPPNSAAFDHLPRKAVEGYAVHFRWMGYAAQLNRCVLGYKSSHILPKRWHDLLPYYDAEHARQLGTRHPQDLIVRVRMLETRWYHTRTNMYRFLYLAGLEINTDITL